MSQNNKPSFSDFKVCKISGGDLLREKPIFCGDGKYLVVSNQETCHMYTTSTGEHVKELFSCDSCIVRLQIDQNDKNKLYAISEKGEIVSYQFDTENEGKGLRLHLKANILTEERVRLFNVDKPTCSWEDSTKNGNWDETLKGEVNFVHAVIDGDLVYASWYTSGEFFGHVSAFSLTSGELLKCSFIPPKVGLRKSAQNFAVENNILLCMSVNFVYVCNLLSVDIAKLHMFRNGVQVRCIALHKEEKCFVTGDSEGKLTVWRNIFDNYPLKEVFHWHTLPVGALALTEFGANMLSGGEENVLVKWSLTTQKKTFLPRLSSHIIHITFAEGNSDLLAISTADSRILIVNTNLTCLVTIQHFSRWAAVKELHQGGILSHDPRTDALVLNARSGHIQFLSTTGGRFMYTFDVTTRNYITREKGINIENVEVRFAKFSRHGKWLITAESGPNEASLKFWLYNEKSREYALNTDIDTPHGSERFISLEVSSDEQVVTTGSDNKFRLWNLIEISNLQATRFHWALGFASDHRQLPVGVADFARDGSIVGVGFGPVLTVWDTSTHVLKCSLTPPLRRNNIKSVRFGNHEVAHLVVTGTDAEVTCWNLVTLCMQWMVPLKLSTLISDPISIYMCAFSKSGGLFIFNPSSAFPEMKFEHVADTEVTSGLFLTKGEVPYIYFLTSDQRLYCLGEDDKVTSKGKEFIDFNPFVAQIAEKSKKDVIAGQGLNHLINPTTNFAMTILDGPAHALPPVSLLLHDVLRSLLLTVSLPENKATTTEDVVVVETVNKAGVSPTLEESQLRKVVDTLFDPGYEKIPK